MKKLLLLLIVITTSVFLYSQTPNQFKYQAVLRNADGTIMAEENVTIVISILKSDLTTSVFYETHNITTTSQGLINLNIGSIEDLSTIDWTLDEYFIEISINGTVMGTSQLLSVPYALHAKTAESVTETDPVYTESQAANITATDIINLGNLSGINTGDQNISGITSNTQAIQDLANQIISEQAQEIEDLNYMLDRKNSKQSFLSDVLALSTSFEDCEVNEYGIDCDEVARISLFVKENDPMILEIHSTKETSQNGEPVVVEETFTIEVEKILDITDNTDFKIHTIIVKGDETHEFDLSPSACLYSARDNQDYNGEVRIKALLLNENMLTYTMGGGIDAIKNIKTESEGAIIAAYLDSINEAKNEIIIPVEVRNYSDLRSNYVVSITEVDFLIEPVITQNIVLYPYTEHNFVFKIHPKNYVNDKTVSFPDEFEILVTLESTTGKLYDKLIVLISTAP
jgi:hypothetical protein